MCNANNKVDAAQCVVCEAPNPNTSGGTGVGAGVGITFGAPAAPTPSATPGSPFASSSGAVAAFTFGAAPSAPQMSVAAQGDGANTSTSSNTGMCCDRVCVFRRNLRPLWHSASLPAKMPLGSTCMWVGWPRPTKPPLPLGGDEATVMRWPPLLEGTLGQTGRANGNLVALMDFIRVLSEMHCTTRRGVVQGVGARRVGSVRRVVQCRTRRRGPTRRGCTTRRTVSYKVSYSTDTVRHSTTQYDTVRHSTTQYDTVRHSMTQYDTVRHSTTQYVTHRHVHM